MNQSKLKDIKNQFKNYPVFYQKVWNACLDIPKGEVRTYGWIAQKIKSPYAARAVGTALGANPFAPYVPCHRVIRSDGKLGGYSGVGGLAAKKKMLLKEGAFIK
jgi:O-6-methylguanine DNA methyltransferase